MASPNRPEPPGKDQQSNPAEASGAQQQEQGQPVTRDEQPTTPAQEWGQRESTGHVIRSGGKDAGPRP